MKLYTQGVLYQLDSAQCQNFELSSRREWLLTNGIGGFAMGTVSGANARRYHGHLVAADPAPAHRTVLLANVEAFIEASGPQIGISTNQYQGAVHPQGYLYLEAFKIGLFAHWQWRVEGLGIEKRLKLHPDRNAVTVVYKNTGTKPFLLNLRPLVQHKYYHSNFRQVEGYPQVQAFPREYTLIEHEGQTLVIRHPAAEREPEQGWFFRFEYARELERGLEARDDMYCPCRLSYDLAPGQEAVLVASTEIGVEPWSHWVQSEPSKDLAEGLRAATHHFFVETPGRTSIIAGYPWFTDWGRDTMISLPGICLHAGRVPEAMTIVRDYASQMHQGLIPNRFVEANEKPEYNTVDATLWFGHAIYKILQVAWNEEFAREALGWLNEVVDWHQRGTLYGIMVDPADGLLTQGADGVQLTWMDAKLGDWVVTPRHGKPVEINGLWINLLRISEWIAKELCEDSSKFSEAAEKAEAFFEKKFWKPALGYYLDTAEPDDASLRPNQVLAMSLPFSPCNPVNARLALGVVSRELLTPVGLRTLGPDDAKYRPVFKGPIAELDAAYHQGTVWPWLMGPYITALVKLTGDRVEARKLLRSGRDLLNEYGLAGIAEVYDGDEPRDPGGCPWQAWSVAEWLRAWVEDVEKA